MIKAIIVFIAYLALYHVVALSIFSFIDMKNWFDVPLSDWSKGARFSYVFIGVWFVSGAFLIGEVYNND